MNSTKPYRSTICKPLPNRLNTINKKKEKEKQKKEGEQRGSCNTGSRINFDSALRGNLGVLSIYVKQIPGKNPF